MKPIKKILAVLLACVMLAALAGCASSSNIQAPAAGAYDFATYWIKDNKLITSVNQSWRIGSAGTTKVTSGDGDGIGAWYAQTMPSAWAFAATVTFDNTGTAAQTATVVFGPDQNTTLLTLTLEFQRNRVRVTTDHNGMQLCRSGWMRANSDGAVKVILDIAQSDGRPRLFLTNPDNQAAGDKTKISFNYKMASLGDDNARLQTFGLGANAAGVSFSYLGVMNNPYQPGKGQIQAMAQQAMNDLMANFWTGTPTDGQFKAKDTDWPLNNSMIWEYGTAMFTVETAWDLTGDPVYKQYIQAQWNYMQKRWTDDAMTRAGQGQPNVAQDDTSWTALTLMTVYRVTGDARALALAAQVARNCFAYFKVNGDTANGLWYRLDDQPSHPITFQDGKNRISAYAAASILVALQYSVATKGTQYFDQTLYDDAVKYYNWIETNLRRTDHLYFVDFYGVNDDSGTPYGVVNPNQAIVEAGSPVALFLSMLMAEVQFELFKYTGDTQYQTLAVESANAIPATPLGNSGVLLNDRDAWTNAVFARYFVEDILPLPGIDQANWALMKNTALSIVQNCRTPDGYWGPDWGGGDKWITQTANSPAGFKTVPQQIMTTANTINLVVAAAIAEKNGQFG